MNLSPSDQQVLLWLARATLQSVVKTGRAPDVELSASELNQTAGAIVSLRVYGEISSQAGYLGDDEPLGTTIRELTARAAAGRPDAFPLQAEELPYTRIEVTVLHDFRPLESLGEIPGRGLYYPSSPPAVRLPDASDSMSALEAFCVQAGLPLDAWEKGAAIQTFAVIQFQEED